MTTVFTEDYHAWSFLISELDGHGSRENADVAAGQNLKAGTIVADDGSGNLIAYLGGTDTAGDAEPALGILGAATDATDGAVPAAYLARTAEVNINVLTFPTESSSGGERVNSIAALKAIGIICR